jgi:hypothetical protein
MSRVDFTLTINLPEDILSQAQAAGLLSTEEIEKWLREELERQNRLENFFGKLDKLSKIEPAISQEEIDAELAAHRREKRQGKSGDSL